MTHLMLKGVPLRRIYALCPSCILGPSDYNFADDENVHTVIESFSFLNHKTFVSILDFQMDTTFFLALLTCLHIFK